MEGIQAEMNALGLALPLDRIQRGEGVYQFGLEATRRWLDLPADRRPDAIVAFNDLMAVGAMRAIQDRGLHVGKDLAVTGFDDVPLAQFTNPALTSVRQPIWDVGQKMMSILLDRLEEKEPEQENMLVDPELIIRRIEPGEMNWMRPGGSLSKPKPMINHPAALTNHQASSVLWTGEPIHGPVLENSRSGWVECTQKLSAFGLIGRRRTYPKIEFLCRLGGAVPKQTRTPYFG